MIISDIPPQYLPPDVSVSIAELNSTFMAEIWVFFGLAVPIVVFSLLLRSWIKNS